MTKSIATVVALLAFGAAPLTAQVTPIVPLGPSTARFADPFTDVGGVREVAPGKVIVVDPRDKVAELVNLNSGVSTRIGREGSGPGEYQYPGAVLPLPNNETLLVDPPQTRFLRIDATGKVVETFGYPGGVGPGMRVRGTDGQGRVYFEGLSFGRPGDGPAGNIVPADSVPVVRWDRRNGKVDSLVMVKGPGIRVGVTGAGNSRNLTVRQQPFAPRDAWGVGPDGRVAIARSRPYRVDIRAASGTTSAGSVVSSLAIPVTSRDKEDLLKSTRSGLRMTRVSGDGAGSGGGSGGAPPALPEPSADEYDWPATKPYFDATSVLMSPVGELWILRSRRAGDEIPVYDVFGADGRLTRRVSFPAKTRLVGFGAGTIYVARSDEDDLQYLERYRDCGVSGCDSRGVPIGR